LKFFVYLQHQAETINAAKAVKENNYMLMRKFVVLWFVIFLPLLLFGERTMTYSDKQIYRGPIFDNTDAYNFHIDSVIIAKDTTYIYSSYFTDEDTWANISDSTYIENTETKERFYILKSVGLPYPPQKLTVKEGEDYEFVFLFPSIGNTKIFNFIENDTLEAFNIYNIDLNNCTNGLLDYVDINQLTHLKDSLVSANDTMRSVKAMELISNVKGYFLGFKSEDYLTSLMELSGLHFYFGHYEQAIAIIDEIISNYPWINRNINIELGLLQAKAKILVRIEKTEEAVSTYNQYISLFNSIDNDNKDWPHYVQTIALLADCYYKRNDRSRAIEYYEECLNICNKEKLYENYLNYLLNLCLSYSKLEKYDDAISVVNREGEAKLDSLKKHDESSYFVLMSVLTTDYILLDELEKAMQCKESMLQMISKRNNNDDEFMSYYREWINQYHLISRRFSDTYFNEGIEL
jgi:tetratricopeptide (TPR) repeat protein